VGVEHVAHLDGLPLKRYGEVALREDLVVLRRVVEVAGHAGEVRHDRSGVLRDRALDVLAADWHVRQRRRRRQDHASEPQRAGETVGNFGELGILVHVVAGRAIAIELTAPSLGLPFLVPCPAFLGGFATPSGIRSSWARWVAAQSHRIAIFSTGGTRSRPWV